jgi:hypothetical protein
MWWKCVSKKNAQQSVSDSASNSNDGLPGSGQDRHQSADFEDIFEKVNEKGGK